MARSLAFWFSEPSNDTTVELHFNYWSLNSGKLDYLDLGVKLSSKSDFKSINFYLPFSKKNLQYKPRLGEVVCKDNELISAIFNDSVVNIKDVNNQDTHDITFSSTSLNSALRFFTQILPEESNSLGGVEITPADDENQPGCILTFPRSLFDFKNLNGHGYFRFRIILNELDKKSISQLYKPKNSQITNYFETIEMVDFRLNEARNLPAKIRSKINDSSHPCVPLVGVHFFLIREANSEYKMSHSAYHRCRLLEKDLWNEYLKDDTLSAIHNTPSQMLIYHWKNIANKNIELKSNNKYIEDFAAFAKFSERHVRKVDILILIVAIIILGIASGLVTNWILLNFQGTSLDAANTNPSEVITQTNDDQDTARDSSPDKNQSDLMAKETEVE